MSTMSLFSPSNANKFITYAPFYLERIIQELIDYLYWKLNPGVVSRLFRMKMMNQIWEMMSFKLVSWLIHIELLHWLTWKKFQIFMSSIIFLLMLTLMSWMLFWAPTDKHKSMKMIIAMKSTFKIVLELTTSQLKKKTILTNYQNTKV